MAIQKNLDLFKKKILPQYHNNVMLITTLNGKM